MAVLPVEPVRSASPLTEQDANRFINLSAPLGLVFSGRTGGASTWDMGQVRSSQPTDWERSPTEKKRLPTFRSVSRTTACRRTSSRP